MKILPLVTQYHSAVLNLKKILMSKRHLILIQNQLNTDLLKDIYTRSIRTLKAKNTYLRTSEVDQACHKFLIFF